MYKFALALLIFFSYSTKANEVAFGLVTAHLFDPGGVSEKFEGCLHKSCEVIYNPILAYRSVKNADTDYYAHTILYGLNSIHDHMAGYYFSLGPQEKNFRFGGIVGTYLQNNQNFFKRGIQPLSFLQIGSTGFVPIMGVEHQYFLHNNLFTNIIITPAIANLGFGFSW